MREDQDFVANALNERVPWESVVPHGSPLLHVTKNITAVLSRGLLPASALPLDYQTFGHSGLVPRGDAISATWSADRANRYFAYLSLLVRAADNETEPVAVMDTMLGLAGVNWSELAPGTPGEHQFGSVFWFDNKWLTPDEQWNLLEHPPEDIRALWLECASRLGVSAWDALLLLDGALLEHWGEERSLGVVNPERSRFLATVAPSLGIVSIAVRPGAIVECRPEEEEVQVRPADIVSCEPWKPVCSSTMPSASPGPAIGEQ